MRDWLHVDDHCRGIEKVIEKGKAGEIYNIGGGEELTNLEITRVILERLGGTENDIEFVEDRKGHDFRYSVDIKKITEQLGYKPEIKFAAGIADTISWYKKNTQWWEPLKKIL